MPKNLHPDRDSATGKEWPPKGLLQAAPQPLSGVSVHYREDGTAQVRYRVNTRSWLGRFLRTKKTVTRERFFNLDQTGAAVWRLIDGSTSLGAIAKSVAESQKRSLPESQRGVIQYTRTLMMRGLIGIEVDQKQSTEIQPENSS